MASAAEAGVVGRRSVYFESHGELETPIHTLHSLTEGKTFPGPAIIETPFTTIVVEPHSRFSRSEHGSVIIAP